MVARTSAKHMTRLQRGNRRCPTGESETSSGLTLFATRGIDEVDRWHRHLDDRRWHWHRVPVAAFNVMGWLGARSTRVRGALRSGMGTGSFLLPKPGCCTGASSSRTGIIAPRSPPDSRPAGRAGSTCVCATTASTHPRVSMRAWYLALSMVEEDDGRDVALVTAPGTVSCQAPGSSPQLSHNFWRKYLSVHRSARSRTTSTPNPTADLSVASLAARASMSPRSLASQFVAET